MATRRKSHTRKHHTRRHRTRKHRTRRGGGNNLNPNAKPFSKLRGNTPAFVPARAAHAKYASRSQGATINEASYRNENIAAAEYNSRTQGATIMEPYSGITRHY